MIEPSGPDVDNSLNTMSSDKMMELGDISRYGVGTAMQTFTIWNMVGMEGSSDALNKEHNDALLAHGSAALQYAVDKQAEEMRDWNLNKDIEDDLRQQWESVPDAPAFQRGFHVPSVRMAEKMDIADFNYSGEMEAAA